MALIWILAAALKGVRERPRFAVTLVLLVLFIPAVVLERRFLQEHDAFSGRRARLALPRDGYVLFQSAKAAFENKDYLSAELFLNRTLSLDMKRETAILVSSLYADIEIARADYPAALRWLNSIEEFEKPAERQRSRRSSDIKINEKKAEIETSGETSRPPRLSSRTTWPGSARSKKPTRRLYDLYIGP